MGSCCVYVLCFSKAIYTAQLPRQTLRSQCAFVFLYQKRVYIIIIFVFRARYPCMLREHSAFCSKLTRAIALLNIHMLTYIVLMMANRNSNVIYVYTLKKFIYIGNCVDNLSLYRRRCACV